MKTVLVVGLGEVGMSLYEIIDESKKYKVYGLDQMHNLNQKIPDQIDIIHICFPYKLDNGFIYSVVNYIFKYKPKLVIINSTVKPKTTYEIFEQCQCNIAFSPVMGTYTNKEKFKQDIKYFGKFVGGVTDEATKLTVEHFNKVGINTIVVKSSLEAEIIKLYCTTYYGLMIALSQDFHRLSCLAGADFSNVMEGICYLNDKSFTKPPVYPDSITGHCVIQNINILENYNLEILKSINKSNEKRKNEVKNPIIYNEIQKIKCIVDKYWRDFNVKNRKKL